MGDLATQKSTVVVTGASVQCCIFVLPIY